MQKSWAWERASIYTVLAALYFLSSSVAAPRPAMAAAFHAILTSMICFQAAIRGISTGKLLIATLRAILSSMVFS